MPSRDGIDPLDPRFPIEKGPASPAFWQALALWETYPSQDARAFAATERAWAVEQNQRRETTYVQPLPPPLEEPPPPPLPVPYPDLAEATLEHDFAHTEPLKLLP